MKNDENTTGKQGKAPEVGRRTFLKTATATTAGLLILNPGSALGADANSKLEIGVLGCGGRGPWIGNLFQENTATKVVALHDAFKDRVDKAAKQLDVPENRRYTGLDGYKELLASHVDAVAIISPPYFHPEQAVAALQAGKHVYLAKPIGVDVPGCLAIVEAAKKANGKLTTLVDFQTRNNPLFREAAKRIHDGEVGKPAVVQGYSHTGRLGVKPSPRPEESRLRNWVFDIALSGDIIVEQNVHVLDVVNWYLQGHPVEARGTGGRTVRTDIGDCWDHFIVTFTYPNDVQVDFSSTQFTQGYDDICIRLFGSSGTVESHYGGEVYLKNKQGGWPGGKTESIYKDGAVNNMKDFCASVRDGKYLNNAEDAAHSTMAGILGRTAAYENRTVTWDEMVAANKKVDAHLSV